MTIERFEELRIWQDARTQANAMYDLFVGEAPGSRDWGFRDQLQRAGVSVMNNIAEGFGRRSYADFARFLDISKRSIGEVRSLLNLAEDRGYGEAVRAAQVRAFSEAISGGIQSLSKHSRI